MCIFNVAIILMYCVIYVQEMIRLNWRHEMDNVKHQLTYRHKRRQLHLIEMTFEYMHM